MVAAAAAVCKVYVGMDADVVDGIAAVAVAALCKFDVAGGGGGGGGLVALLWLMCCCHVILSL